MCPDLALLSLLFNECRKPSTKVEGGTAKQGGMKRQLKATTGRSITNIVEKLRQGPLGNSLNLEQQSICRCEAVVAQARQQ